MKYSPVDTSSTFITKETVWARTEKAAEFVKFVSEPRLPWHASLSAQYMPQHREFSVHTRFNMGWFTLPFHVACLILLYWLYACGRLQTNNVIKCLWGMIQYLLKDTLNNLCLCKAWASIYQISLSSTLLKHLTFFLLLPTALLMSSITETEHSSSVITHLRIAPYKISSITWCYNSWCSNWCNV